MVRLKKPRFTRFVQELNLTNRSGAIRTSFTYGEYFRV